MESEAQDLSKIPEHKRVLFVRPTGNYDSSIPATSEKQSEEQGTLTGPEARAFYEELLAEEPSTSVDVKPQKKPPVRPSIEDLISTEEFTDRDCRLFLVDCANGDVKKVTNWFERGMDLNHQDEFGWTPLHIAAASGHTKLVLFLIEHGANWSIRERTGKTFDAMCNTATLAAVWNWFDRQAEDDDLDELEPMGHCSSCDRNYTGSTADHLTNLSHLVRLNKQNPQHSGFVIPEWNPGFRLLRKAGWTEDRGLGKDRQGKKYPIRTVLKRNRAGFGLRSEVARVTHFGPRDERAVSYEKQERREETKEQREKRIRRDKDMERGLRWMFTDPS